MFFRIEGERTIRKNIQDGGDMVNAQHINTVPGHRLAIRTHLTQIVSKKEAEQDGDHLPAPPPR